MGKIDKIKDKSEKDAIEKIKETLGFFGKKLKDKDFEISDDGHLISLKINKSHIGKGKLPHIFEPFDKLSKLKILDLKNIQISDISVLSNLKHLRELEILNLEENLIKKIEGLEHFTNLKELYLKNNEITELRGLENLSKLQILEIDEKKLNEKNKILYEKGIKAVINYYKPIAPTPTPEEEKVSKKQITYKPLNEYPDEISWYKTGLDIDDYEEAIEFFKQGLNGPKEFQAYAHLGIGNRIIDDDYNIAMENYLKAKEINPNIKEVWVGLGEVYHNFGENDKAIKAYEESIELDPQNPHPYAWYGLGMVYKFSNQIEKAINAIENAIKFDKENFYDPVSELKILKKIANQDKEKLDAAKKIPEQGFENGTKKMRKIYKAEELGKKRGMWPLYIIENNKIYKAEELGKKRGMWPLYIIG